MNSSEGKSRKNIKRVLVAACAVMVLLCTVSVLGTAECFAALKPAEEAQQQQTIPTVSNEAFEIVSFRENIRVDKSHSYYVTEEISVNLPSDLTSIQFPIQNGNFRIRDIRIENAEYKANRKQDDTMVILYDEDKLKAGHHTYKLEYTIHEFSDRDEEKDMFYMDVLLPSFRYSIGELSISLSFPDDFPWGDIQYYAGQYGVQSVETKLDYVADEASKTVTISGSRIPENFGISVKSQLNENYWVGALDGIWTVRFTLLMMIAVIMFSLILWMIGGRDPRFASVRQTHPIEGISISEIGYIFNGDVSIRDIIALIVYFGTKGYLQISEYEPKKFRLIRRNEPVGEEKFVRNAYELLFEGVYKDRDVDMDELGLRLMRIKNAISEDVAAGFMSKDMVAFTTLSLVFRILSSGLLSLGLGTACALTYAYNYFSVNYVEAVAVATYTMLLLGRLCHNVDRQYFSEDKQYKTQLTVSVIAAMVAPIYVAAKIGLSTEHWLLSVFVLVLSVIGGFLVIIMRRRATGNAALVTRLISLRQFIYHPTPKEVVTSYVADHRYYYDMVPYALLFNGLESWAISFLTLNVPTPDWITDDIEGHAFSNLRKEPTVLDYARDIKAFYRTMISSYHSMERKHRRG